MISAQSLFKTKNRKSWFANFDDRPGKLFDDLTAYTSYYFSLLKKKMNLNTATLYATTI